MRRRNGIIHIALFFRRLDQSICFAVFIAARHCRNFIAATLYMGDGDIYYRVLHHAHEILPALAFQHVRARAYATGHAAR